MARITTVSESVVVNAPAADVYAKVSDPRNLGKWSPENTGATLRQGDDGPAYVGMDFWGHNKRGPMKWATQCIVTAADPGKRFAFRVVGQRFRGKERARLRFDIATWEYRLEEVEGGTRVTETWVDDRSSSLFGRTSRMQDRIFTGGPSFPDLHSRNMKVTLQRLKAEIESGRGA